MALLAWLITTAITAAGLFAIALGIWYHWTGAYLLIAPLLISTGVTMSAILAGLRSPWWVLALFIFVEALFVLFRYFNFLGIGAGI